MNTKSCITGLVCPKCNKSYDHREIQHLCQCGSPLLAEYDTEKAVRTIDTGTIKNRPATLWRYAELLPVLDTANIVSLGEGFTPLTPLPGIAGKYDLGSLYMKDEGIIPTGTFKARGAAVGVSKAKELGVRDVAMPTNGNAGAAAAL